MRELRRKGAAPTAQGTLAGRAVWMHAVMRGKPHLMGEASVGAAAAGVAPPPSFSNAAAAAAAAASAACLWASQQGIHGTAPHG